MLYLNCLQTNLLNYVDFLNSKKYWVFEWFFKNWPNSGNSLKNIKPHQTKSLFAVQKVHFWIHYKWKLLKLVLELFSFIFKIVNLLRITWITRIFNLILCSKFHNETQSWRHIFGNRVSQIYCLLELQSFWSNLIITQSFL